MARGPFRWVTVYTGPVWRAFAIQSMLDEAGYVTLVPNANTRTADPFMTGGDVFSLSVLVPENDFAAARAVVESQDPATERSESPPRDAGTGRIAHSMRWLTTLTLTAPIALVLGLVYLNRVRRSGVRPPEHGFNLLTISVAGLFTVAAVVAWVSIWSEGY